jgi:hypothetical protein
MSMKIKVKKDTSWGNCQLYVEGLDMNCPLCGELVPSGYAHDCQRDGGITTKRTRKAAKTIFEASKSEGR